MIIFQIPLPMKDILGEMLKALLEKTSTDLKNGWKTIKQNLVSKNTALSATTATDAPILSLTFI